MAHRPARSERSTKGFAHHGGNRPSGPGTTQSVPNPTSQQYNPQNDMHYIKALRPPRDDYSRFSTVMGHPALQTGSESSYAVPYASRHGADAGWCSFGNTPSAPHARPTQSGEANAAQSAGHSSYTPPISHRAPLHDYSEPYNAVGSIRGDGRVYDNAEVFEEYRPYEQVDRVDENWSDHWTHVSLPRPSKLEDGNLQNYRSKK